MANRESWCVEMAINPSHIAASRMDAEPMSLNVSYDILVLIDMSGTLPQKQLPQE